MYPATTPTTVTINASYDDYLAEKFRHLASKYEISEYFVQKIKQLQGFEIVIIADDSSSMDTRIGGKTSGFGRDYTRWDELKKIMGIIVDISSVMDKNGLDLYFLNRGVFTGISDSSQLTNIFLNDPNGFTPISPVLDNVLQAKKQVALEKKVLVIIVTDGIPTNKHGDKDIQTLESIVAHARNPLDNIYFTFAACTDDLTVINYLNNWDNKYKNVDVLDDYISEREEIRKHKGNKFHFSFGDYVVKMLIGSIDPEFDNLDNNSTSVSCCTIM